MASLGIFQNNLFWRNDDHFPYVFGAIEFHVPVPRGLYREVASKLNKNSNSRGIRKSVPDYRFCMSFIHHKGEN